MACMVKERAGPWRTSRSLPPPAAGATLDGDLTTRDGQRHGAHHGRPFLLSLHTPHSYTSSSHYVLRNRLPTNTTQTLPSRSPCLPACAALNRTRPELSTKPPRQPANPPCPKPTNASGTSTSAYSLHAVHPKPCAKRAHSRFPALALRPTSSTSNPSDQRRTQRQKAPHRVPSG